jgi:NAD(P)-dependent dehydrogenase (short-subunit alcohol dehydrogenase family)
MRTVKQLFDLTGKVALCTASSKGMGLAMAEALAEQGAKVVVSSRKQDACDVVAASINEQFGEGVATAIACNIGYKDQLQELVDQTHEKVGKIDILVSNGGVNPFYGPMSEIPDAAFDKIMNSNVRSNHWLCQMVLPDMIAAGKGSIMITASTGALGASDTLGTYNISKLADIALVRNLALENGPHGIRVNAICPGVIKTDFARALWDNPEGEARAAEMVPLRKFGEADDLKGLAAYLASDASGHMTGQALVVCGGSNMWS